MWFSGLFVFLLMSVGFAQEIPVYHISTEDYPPYSFLDSETNQILGHSTEKVRKLMRLAGYSYDIKLYPWLRAYNRGQMGARYCVYSTARNVEREKIFHWIGPLVRVEWALFAKKGTPASRVQNMEEAKEYVVGGLEGDASLMELKRQAFIRVR